MIKDCNTKNPLLRDGTSQQQRLLKALLPSYVSVDERSMQDLITFANNFGKEINYFDVNNTVAGDWQSFFKDMVIDEAGQTTQPHYALFIAFLEIFRFAQDDLNTITQRHLDFYYRDVLQLKEKDAIPDQVFIIFTLAEQVASHLITAGTALDAKKDATGVDLVYDTTKDIVVNTAQISELQALFYNKQFDKRLYASPIANSADGKGKEIEGDEKKWETFGNLADPSLPFNSPLIDRQQAEVGFAFAAPILQMKEGNRFVNITLTFGSDPNISNTELQDAFNVLFSGEKDWIAPSTNPKSPTDRTYVGAAGTNTIIIQRTITPDQPAIVNYSQAVLNSPFNTTWPVLKIVLNTNGSSSPYIYEKLKTLVITSCEISVDVTGVKNLILQNDQSTLDASKPFQPFGNRPVLTSSFYIGSQEAFSKSLTSVDINITWKGLPENAGGFGTYYDNYISSEPERTNSAFKASISLLEGKSWQTVVPDTSSTSQLFNTIAGPDQKVDSLRDIHIPAGDLAFLNRDAAFSLETFTKYDNNTARGFMRLELANVDFGHHDFQNSFATQALIAAKQPLGTTSFSLPNEPYTPVISELSLNYTSTVTIQLVNNATVNNATAFNNRVDQFFHVEPFGVAENHPFITKNTSFINLLPVYNDEGSLYIGLSGLNPSETLSILFKVAEGSANPDFAKQPVKWSYMVNNEWEEFPQLKIISDTTNGLLTSGIVTFDISKLATNNNTLFTTGLHWLKASVEDFSAAVCEMIDIQTQAVLAAFVDNGNDPNHLLQSLPANTISSLVVSDDAVDKVTQPYASFGGKIKEQSNDFYTRVSERLRHKNRAVNIWDYEHLVLENFPTIYKVKCLNTTKYISSTDIKEVAPGHVSLVTIADLKNKNAVNLLQPKTSLILLTEIEDFIKTINPPCVQLHVKNPLYEEIAVEFNVRFLPGFDNGFYGQKLEDDLKKFLAPWAYSVTDISFGGKIHKSVLINFVEEQPYVDFVTCFKMDQIVGTTVLKNIEEAVTTTGASILTSASSHIVHVLETDDCDCDDNIVLAPYEPVDKTCDCDCDCGHGSSGSSGTATGSSGRPRPRPFGVGAFAVAENFIVGNGTGFTSTGINFMGIEKDFTIKE
ncbi:MAG: baseplate J/gp47 family protein [Bacteroidia bacterium]